MLGDMATPAPKIAISSHLGRIAPLFDASEEVELFEQRPDGAERIGSLALSGETPAGRAALMRENGVAVLICGAISAYAHNVLASGGIQVHPWVCGPVDSVLEAYLTNALSGPAWMMPGCGRGRPWGGKRRRGRGGRGPAW